MERTESKLFNNNLYGKLAMSDNSSYMKPYLLDEVVHYELVEEHKRDVFSIPCGSICTAAARYYTITHAQDNYEYFCYADTDSLHLEEGDYKNIIIDPAKLGCWKHETHWSSAYFYRQKTYCEFIREENGEKQHRTGHSRVPGCQSAERSYFSVHAQLQHLNPVYTLKERTLSLNV